MPCRDDGHADYHDRITQEARAKSDKEYKSKVDNLTRMLCMLCAYLDKIGELHDLHAEKDGTEILEWYADHKDWDEKRLAAAKKSGLAKLSQDEREALGL